MPMMRKKMIAGEILLSEYLRPMGISKSAMARSIRVAPRTLNEIVIGKRAITPAMSIRFGAFFGQSEFDFRSLHRKKEKLVSTVRPASSLTSAR